MKVLSNIAVALPVGEPFELVWLHGVHPALQEMAVLGTRLNLLLSSIALRVQARQTISTADYLIADVTGNNPAVLYYIGVAESLSKPVILVARHAETVAFQTSQAILTYADDPSLLRTQLISRLSQGEMEASEAAVAKSLAAPSVPISVTGDAAKFFEIFGDILQQHGYRHHGEIRCENEKTFLLIEQDMDLPLVEDLSRRARERGLRLKLL